MSRFKKRINGFVGVCIVLWLLVMVWVGICVWENPQEYAPPPEKPDPAKINARNIETLRQLLEEETGKTIVFMAEGKEVGE